ncbi:hypothetical protein EYF80_032818 [Liparis tanakae]|uniref:Uncharacterized protein n=1 Tax=Liparis tanakae TaxID=230148 RepID=A0A4Z2GTS0_9TELE|nr:hypothetical protein EYF80_032818 [Liparis tanakae]
MSLLHCTKKLPGCSASPWSPATDPSRCVITVPRSKGWWSLSLSSDREDDLLQLEINRLEINRLHLNAVQWDHLLLLFWRLLSTNKLP